MAEPKKLTIMVSSTVYGRESLLDQVYALLVSYGYDVWMSHKGSLPVHPGKSNFENCLNAVDNCDAFVGIIFGKYGTGVLPGETSILHQEVSRAIASGKMRWFLVHHDVTIARTLLRQFRFDAQGAPLPLVFKKTNVLEDIRILDMYDEIIGNAIPLPQRVGNWAQPFYEEREVLIFLETQFADPQRIRKMLPRRSGRRSI